MILDRRKMAFNRLVCVVCRVREVGEDVLLDMSEVLFNELAFLRIMRDLDNPVAMEKIRKQSWFNSVRILTMLLAKFGSSSLLLFLI